MDQPITIQHALQFHRAGQLAEAERIYRQILAQNPNNVDALHLLGTLAYQAGHSQAARELIERAIAINPLVADYYLNLGSVLESLKQSDRAIESYRRVLSLNPQHAQAYFNMGNALRRQGKISEAIASYRKAIEINPSYIDAYTNLGVCLNDNKQHDEAIALYRRAIELRPDFAPAFNNMANAMRAGGDLAGAIEACKRAIALRPEYPECWNNLGNCMKDQENHPKAIEAYRNALAAKPDYPEVLKNLASTLKEIGNLDEAAALLRRAMELQPEFFEAASELAGIYKEQARPAEAVKLFEFASRIHPDDAAMAGYVLLVATLLADWDNARMFAALRQWDERYARPLMENAPHENSRDPNRKLRVGYVSADFWDHVAGHNLIPLLREHDRDQFEIYLYSNVEKPDSLTNSFRALGHWRNIWKVEDAPVARMIRDDRIDVLVDLSLHSAANRLLVLARKPAPVQATFCGYPGGTGMSAIDYRLTDPYLDPPEHDAFYAEKSVRLPHSFWCYDAEGMRLKESPPVNLLPAIASGAIAFGCLNNFCKVNDEMLDAWKRVLDAVPGSTLLLLTPQGAHRERVAEKLDGRVRFEDRRPRLKYLEIFGQIDIVLDTFPYNGHTTGLDALWMGVPVVTLVGETAVSRAAWSQLSNLGLGELAACTPDQFVEIAIGLARDVPRLVQLRSTLRQKMKNSPLMDAPGFARAIETAYRQFWRTWCEAPK